MSFIWFTAKIYIFDMLYSTAIGFALTPLIMLVAAVSPKEAQSSSVAHSESSQKSPIMDVLTLMLVIILCSTQGVIVAAAVKLSLISHPDAWWPFWYLVGFGASLPYALIKFTPSDDDIRSQGGQVAGFVSAAGGYIAVCIWPTIVPKLLLRVSMVLAV